MLYLLSDDNFFAIGLISICQKKGRKMTQLDEKDIAIINYSLGDTVFIATNNRAMLVRVMKSIEPFKLRVFLFPDLPKGLKPLSILSWSICSRRISPSEFTSILDLKHWEYTLQLTRLQFLVLHSIYRGENYLSIANNMECSLKMISAHKRKALERFGEGMASLAILEQIMFIIDTVLLVSFNISTPKDPALININENMTKGLITNGDINIGSFQY